MSEPIYQQANALPPQVATGQIPVEITQQAEINALGPFVRAFRPTNIWVALGITVGVLVLDIILNYLIWLAGYVVYYLWIVPILVIIYAVNAIRTNNHKAFLYQGGFIYTSGSQLNVIRWDRVEAVWMKVVRTSRYGSARHTYTIKSPDGSQVVISSHLKKVKELGDVIMNEVTRRHLPLARQAYASGVPVSFGDLSVSLQGIGFRDKLLPWPEVKDVKLVNGSVQVKKQGSMLSWATIDVAKVSNLPILLQLVTDGLSAQPQYR
ncbi:DUF6585 family protein [Ktedonobacter racemifer]|uniref:Uncharacterized protein n=1 Tax=Ktedonobacter racemifer DSM 44963 TaxID=485913 RepID=D6TPA5_KTERA|nr:DUF6585 family protein [Ktedonobacter racemifer]EFH87461.1 conserved hypothetical protein [Ktedonobacter racemifer DSM 44963]